MAFEKLQTVVLERDLSEHGLRAGDLGAIVETYGPGELEVEFVAASGLTRAVVSLTERDVRPVDDDDVLIPPRVVIDRASGRQLIARLEGPPKKPTQAMSELFDE